MRAIHLTDLNLAVRTLLAVPMRDQVALMKRLLVMARTADKFRKRIGRVHLVFGNGSLGAACQRFPKVPMPDRCDHTYLDCLQIVVTELRNHATNEIL